MHILHISNSYGGTKVYENLYTQLDRLEVRQTVFVPLNPANHSRVGNQMIEFQTEGSKIIYSTVLKPRHRIFYMAKIDRLPYAEICKLTGITLATVNYHVAYAMESLKRRLAPGKYLNEQVK